MPTVAQASPVKTDTEPFDAACNVQRLCEDDVHCMAAAWNRLAGNVPFHRWEWLVNWWKHFHEPTDELFVLAVRDDSEKLVGLAPWFRARTPAGGGIIQFLGSGSACSEYMGLLCLPGWQRRVARAIASWLGEPQPGDHWHAMLLNSVDPLDDAVGELIYSLSRTGHVVHQTPGADTWHVLLPASWEEYLANLTAHRRRRLRRLCRHGLESGRAVCRPVAGGDELDKGLELLCRLSRERRSASDEPSTLACPKLVSFLRDAAHGLLKTGHLQFRTLLIDGRPAAVVCSFIGDGTYYGYQMALDPSAKREDPGWLLLISEMQTSIDRGLHTFDFLRGSERYKAHWRAKPRPQIDVRIAARSTRGEAAHGVWLARQHGRARLQALMQQLRLRKRPSVTPPKRM